MSGLPQRKQSLKATADKSMVVDLDDQGAQAVLEVLSVATARDILSALYLEPTVQSDLADQLDTSIQNVDHHLGNLVDVGLVTVVGEWRSEKGRPMDVYGPANESLALIMGDRTPAVDNVQPGDTALSSLTPHPTD